MWLVYLQLVLLLLAFNMHLVVTQSTAAGNTSDANVTEITEATTTGPVRVNLARLSPDIHCKFQANAHHCTTRTQRRYYFDLQLHRCERFDYASCNHSYNMFTGRHECLNTCQDVAYARAPDNATANVFCRFQPQFGDCNSYHPMWYFDITIMKCRGFAYSGCGGNYNRFHTNPECLSTCGAVILKD
ncbi:kunitz-type serine protease inhibitor A [Helicoverpa armigera]|uniref:kunitz-type serine protease inhibitor A n=1 Tax=Helicoverpa armigera TaxID=29058 RepID=UPI003083CD7E